MISSDEAVRITEEAILYGINSAGTSFTVKQSRKRTVHTDPSTTTEDSGSTRDIADVATDITSVGADRADTSSPDHRDCLDSSSPSSAASVYDDTRERPEQRFQDIGSQFRDFYTGRWPEELDFEGLEVAESFEEEWSNGSESFRLESETVAMNDRRQELVPSKTNSSLEAQHQDPDSAEPRSHTEQSPIWSKIDWEIEGFSPSTIATASASPLLPDAISPVADRSPRTDDSNSLPLSQQNGRPFIDEIHTSDSGTNSHLDAQTRHFRQFSHLKKLSLAALTTLIILTMTATTWGVVQTKKTPLPPAVSTAMGGISVTMGSLGITMWVIGCTFTQVMVLQALCLAAAALMVPFFKQSVR